MEQMHLSPSKIPGIAEEGAIEKVNNPTGKTLVFGFLAGVYISMGGVLSLLIGNGFPEWSANNPGLQKLLSGSMFPIGLIMIIFAGAELFTGNNATLIPGVLNKRYKWNKVFLNWTLIWISNFIGALFFAYVLIYLTGIIDADPWHSAIISTAEMKTAMPWHIVFIKGIGANWLVCLAVWLGLTSRSTTGKVIGLWFPVMCFVAIGFEHSIANMFYIPSGIFQGANVTWTSCLIDNLIPATLGNIVGGGFFVGGVYWFLYNK